MLQSKSVKCVEKNHSFYANEMPFDMFWQVSKVIFVVELTIMRCALLSEA